MKIKLPRFILNIKAIALAAKKALSLLLGIIGCVTILNVVLVAAYQENVL